MTTMIVVATLAFLLATSAVLAAARSASDPMPRASRHTTPIDHAERILAARYARGLINAQEYERMLSVLRR